MACSSSSSGGTRDARVLPAPAALNCAAASSTSAFQSRPPAARRMECSYFALPSCRQVGGARCSRSGACVRAHARAHTPPSLLGRGEAHGSHAAGRRAGRLGRAAHVDGQALLDVGLGLGVGGVLLGLRSVAQRSAAPRRATISTTAGKAQARQQQPESRVLETEGPRLRPENTPASTHISPHTHSHQVIYLSRAPWASSASPPWPGPQQTCAPSRS